MNSRIFSDGQRPSVEWATRDTPGSARTSPITSRLPPPTIDEDPRSEGVASTARTTTPNLSSNEYFLTPETDHPPVTSPDPIAPGNVIDSAFSQPNPPGWSPLPTKNKPSAQHSAPAEMHQPHERLSGSVSLQGAGTWDEVRMQRLRAKSKREDTLEGVGEETPPMDDQEEGEVDGTLPVEKGEPLQRPAPKVTHTAPLPNTTAGLVGTTLGDPGSEQQTPVDRAPVPPGDSTPAGGSASGRAVGWGTPFKVQWIRTDPLSFHRTKHIKNPWNSDVRFNFLPNYLLTYCFQREVKVSRDGTEIEPSIGQILIDEWEKIEPPPRPNQAGETATCPSPIAPLPRTGGGRERSMRNAPGSGSRASKAS